MFPNDQYPLTRQQSLETLNYYTKQNTTTILKLDWKPFTVIQISEYRLQPLHIHSYTELTT